MKINLEYFISWNILKIDWLNSYTQIDGGKGN